MQEPAGPIPISNRIELLDVLRGFALMGMVVVHMVDYSVYQPKGFGPATDFLLSSKMLSLFSFLFGAGFAVQMFRAEARGRAFLPLYLRRMFVLFAFGALQTVFLGWTSILEDYAIIGCMLLLLRRIPFRGVLVATLMVLSLAEFAGPINQRLNPDASAQGRALRRQRVELINRTKKSGTYLEVVSLQFESFQLRYRKPWWAWILLPRDYFAICLLGFAAALSGLLERLGESRRLLKTTLWCGLFIGLIANPLPYLDVTIPGQGPLVTRLSFLLAGPSLALFYGAAIALAYQTERGRKLFGWLRWPGRMALTNYVLQASLVVLLFYGFGLGLMKTITVPQAWALGLAACFVITGFSMAWLRRFEFGPLEWLWRLLTYGRSAGRSLPALADLSAQRS